jgi:hypothetical protein
VSGAPLVVYGKHAGTLDQGECAAVCTDHLSCVSRRHARTNSIRLWLLLTSAAKCTEAASRLRTPPSCRSQLSLAGRDHDRRAPARLEAARESTPHERGVTQEQ